MILNRRVPLEERPVLLRARAAVDSDGDPVESWTNPQVLQLPHGSQVQDRDSVEEDGAVKRLTTTTRVLYVPGRPIVTAKDRVRIGSEVWRVDGEPTVHRGLRGPSYTTAKLSRVQGG